MDIDNKQFEEIYRQYYDRLVIIARRYVRDSEAARDLVMDSFAAFWISRKELPDGTNEPAYITSTVKNRCLNWLQAHQLHLEKQIDYHSEQSRLVSESIRSLKSCSPERLFASEVMEILNRELDRMPLQTRRVFEASRFESKTYSEISAELGIPLRRVTAEMQYALATLRKALADYLPAVLIAWLIER